MHSKLIRLQTALLTLALLFTVLVPVSAYAEGETATAQATADGSTTISDPNTLNAWERTQAYNNATTGRIWADKTVEEDEITFSGELKDQPAIKVSDTKDADFLRCPPMRLPPPPIHRPWILSWCWMPPAVWMTP